MLVAAQIQPVQFCDPAGSGSLLLAGSCAEALVLSSGILRWDSEESSVLPEFPAETVRLGTEADDPARVPPRIALHLRLAVDVDPWSR